MAGKTYEDLVTQIKACRLCADVLPHAPRPVLQPSATAQIIIAGQAPGRRVHETGVPFNDPSGDTLRSWMGVTRAQFYDPDLIAIIPMGFCFPGTEKGKGDLPPRPECRANWHDALFQHMPSDRLVLVIGRYAMDYHMGVPQSRPVGDVVAAWRDTLPHFFPLPHPSPRNRLWIRRRPWFEAQVIPALQEQIAARINRP